MRANFLLIKPTAFLSLSLYLFEATLVQAFYLQKQVNLLQIATEGFSTVFGSGSCPQRHVKSAKI